MKKIAIGGLAACLFLGMPPVVAQVGDVVKFTGIRTKDEGGEPSKVAKVSVCVDDLTGKSKTCRVLVTAHNASMLNCDVVLKFKDVTIAETAKPIPSISTSGSVMVTLDIPEGKLIGFDQFDSILYVEAGVSYRKK